MWKLVVGFIAIIAIASLVGLAIHWYKEMKEEDDDDGLPKDYCPDVRQLIREIDSVKRFFTGCKLIPPSVQCYSQPMADILDKIIKILTRFPERANRLNGLTEYVLPLAKKFIGDLKFYRDLDMPSEVSQKGTMSCKEGLVYIQAMLTRIADSMLEDVNIDIEGELKAFLSLHEVYVDPIIDGHFGAGFTTEEEVQRIHQYVSDFREGKQRQSNVRPGVNMVQKGGNGSVQIQIAGSYTGD